MCNLYIGDTISLYTALTPKLGKGGPEDLLGGNVRARFYEA